MIKYLIPLLVFFFSANLALGDWARVEKGEVREIIKGDKLPPFTPEITAQFKQIPVDLAVKERWRFDGTNWSPPPAPTSAEIDARKEVLLNDAVIKALIEAIEDKFSMARGQFRRMIKDKLL